MPDQLQLRGGTTAQHASFTGASKEVTVDTTKKTLVVHDGSTAGGNPLLREDQSNLPTTAPTTGIYNASGSLAISTGGSGRLFVDASGNVGIGRTPLAGQALALQGVKGITSLTSSTGTNGVYHYFQNTGGLFYLGVDSSTGSDFGASYAGAIYQYGAYPIVFGTNGTEKARLTSDGKLGVGTSSVDRLFIASDSADNNLPCAVITKTVTGGANSGLQVHTAGTDAGAGAYCFRVTAGNTYGSPTSEYLRVTAAGRVGIGSSTPGQKFVVNGTSGSNAIQIENSDDANRGGRLLATGSAASGVFQINSTSGGYGITLGIDGNEAVRVDTSRRLLVGTSSTLPVYYSSTPAWNSAFQVARSNQDAVANFSIWDSNASTYTIYGGAQIHLSACKSGTVGSHTSGALANGDSIASINFNASDGTNFRNAARIEAVVDAASGTADVPGRLVFSTTADGASSPTERMRIDRNGWILINNTNITPGFGNTGTGFVIENSSAGSTLFLSRDNNAAAFFGRNGDGTLAVFTRSGTTVGTISVSTTATAYNTSSDYRLKENVTAVTDGITRLQQLKPSRFNFIADPGKTVDGFLAHEVQTIVPEAITGEKDAVDDDGKPVYQGIDQSKLVPLLTAALQEAVAKIESLETRLTAAGI